jgi:Endonuclease/Exonuclease/phosphatase family
MRCPASPRQVSSRNSGDSRPITFVPGNDLEGHPFTNRMKLAIFNINGISQRLDALLDWLKTGGPDVVCLQELKADDNRFPTKAIKDAGYANIKH